jgi:regulator of protease activity HflC (stomatin/prohibitin superfamily)
MKQPTTGGFVGLGCLGVLVLVFFIGFLASGAQVNAGYVGVMGTWGSVDQNQQPLGPGFHIVMPFATHIESISVQPQNHEFSQVNAASLELQDVFLDGGVNYHIDPSAAAKIYIEGGVDAVVRRVFDPAFQDYIKEIVPQYTTTEILAHRSDIRDSVEQKLRPLAESYGIHVDNVFITNIGFSKQYTAAIEAKQIAQQQLAQAQIEANTKIAKAEGDAKANALQSQGLTPELIQWLIIQKWDGKLPQVTGGGSPFITLKPQ